MKFSSSKCWLFGKLRILMSLNTLLIHYNTRHLTYFKKWHFYPFSWCFTESYQIVTGTTKWIKKRKLLSWVGLYSFEFMECSEEFRFLTLVYSPVWICFCYQIDYCKSNFLLAFICHSEMNSQIIMHILLKTFVVSKEKIGNEFWHFIQCIIWYALMVRQYIVIKRFCGRWCGQTFWLDKSFSIMFFFSWDETHISSHKSYFTVLKKKE